MTKGMSINNNSGKFPESIAPRTTVEMVDGIEKFVDEKITNGVGEFGKKYYQSSVDDIGYPFPNYYLNRLNVIAKKLNKDNLNIGFITDNHWQYGGYSVNGLNHYSYMAYLSRNAPIQAVVMGGDNINGDQDFKEKLAQTKQVMSVMLGRLGENTDLFPLIGNHDTGIGQGGGMSESNNLSPDQLEQIYRNDENLFGESRNNGSNYGFKDYTKQKIRLIFLNSFDLPTKLNSLGEYEHSFVNESGYRNKQLNWVAHQALNVPGNDWQVIIFSHAPLSGTFLGNYNQKNSETLTAIINAFQNGEKYAVKSDGEFGVDIDVDYSSQGKGTIIGFITGHVHEDGQMMYQGINCIETTNSLCQPTLNPWRVPNTKDEDAWDIYSIDKSNRKISITRFGYGDNREFSY